MWFVANSNKIGEKKAQQRQSVSHLLFHDNNNINILHEYMCMNIKTHWKCVYVHFIFYFFRPTLAHTHTLTQAHQWSSSLGIGLYGTVQSISTGQSKHLIVPSVRSMFTRFVAVFVLLFMLYYPCALSARHKLLLKLDYSITAYMYIIYNMRVHAFMFVMPSPCRRRRSIQN